jgi:hypothetical protein
MELIQCNYQDCHYKKTNQRHYHGSNKIMTLKQNESYCTKCKKKYVTIDKDRNRYEHCGTCCETYITKKCVYPTNNILGNAFVSYDYDHHCKCKNQYVVAQNLSESNFMNFIPITPIFLASLLCIDYDPDEHSLCEMFSCCNMTRVYDDDSFIAC